MSFGLQLSFCLCFEFWLFWFQNIVSMCEDLRLLKAEIIFWNWEKNTAGVIYRLSHSIGKHLKSGTNILEYIRKDIHNKVATTDTESLPWWPYTIVNLRINKEIKAEYNIQYFSSNWNKYLKNIFFSIFFIYLKHFFKRLLKPLKKGYLESTTSYKNCIKKLIMH